MRDEFSIWKQIAKPRLMRSISHRPRFFLSLAALEGSLVSRSQAKQVATRFEKFGEVELDFTGVESIGQAFADELLRVWPLAHPNTKLVVSNASDAVFRMIRHIKARSDLPQAPASRILGYPDLSVFQVPGPASVIFA